MKQLLLQTMTALRNAGYAAKRVAYHLYEPDFDEGSFENMGFDPDSDDPDEVVEAAILATKDEKNTTVFIVVERDVDRYYAFGDDPKAVLATISNSHDDDDCDDCDDCDEDE